MLRSARYALVAVCVVALAGCQTTEIKNTDSIGLASGIPTGTTESGYGDHHGDAVGGGGAAAPLDARKEVGEGDEHEGH